MNNFIEFLWKHIFDILTALIALYWAGLSTINYLKSKKWLKIHLNYYIILNWYFFYKQYNNKVIVSITNTWNNIEKINMLGFILKDWKVNFLNNIDSRVFWKIIKLSRKLEPTDNFKITFLKKDLISYFQKHNLFPKYFAVWNTSGEVFKVKFDYNKLLRENAKNIK